MKLDADENVLSQEEIEGFVDLLRKMDEVHPFKRVKAPKHLLDRWNDEIGSKEGKEIKEMAFTISKDAEISDEEIWNMMTGEFESKRLDFGDLSLKKSNPPETGMKKRKLTDI